MVFVHSFTRRQPWFGLVSCGCDCNYQTEASSTCLSARTDEGVERHGARGEADADLRLALAADGVHAEFHVRLLAERRRLRTPHRTVDCALGLFRSEVSERQFHIRITVLGVESGARRFGLAICAHHLLDLGATAVEVVHAKVHHGVHHVFIAEPLYV